MENEDGGFWIAVGLAAALAAGAGLYFGRSLFFPKAEPAPASASRKEDSPWASVSLDQSDAVLRERAAGLSSHPKWSDWLKTEDLLRRFAAATAILADGKSPRASLELLAPAKPFSATSKGGRVALDPRSYARYDAVAGAVSSIDAQGAAKVFQELKPLFQKAYGELGTPNRDFQETLVSAIDGLLKTPVVRGDVFLRKKVVTYAMTDEALERLTPAQKHLLRMGPDNAVKVQTKLREFALALGTRDDRLAVPQVYAPAAR